MTQKLVVAIIQVAVGIVFIIGGFHKDTKLGGRGSRSGPDVPISTVGRVIFIALGLIVFYDGVRYILGF